MRKRWPGMDEEAVCHLESRGWTLTRAYEWVRPTFPHVVSIKEYDAIDYMADEWDFNGLAKL